MQVGVSVALACCLCFCSRLSAASCPPHKHLFTNCSNPCGDDHQPEVFCSVNHESTCRPDYCGGCIPRFYDDNGLEVHCNEEIGIYCEMRQMTLSCIQVPGTFVVVTWANYGRTSPYVCLHPYGLERLHNTSECLYPGTADILNRLCKGKAVCSAVIDNHLFKVDPCYGIYKYLQVDYVCQKITPSLSGAGVAQDKLWSLAFVVATLLQLS